MKQKRTAFGVLRKMASRENLPLLRGMFIAPQLGRSRSWSAYLESLAIGLPKANELTVNPTEG